MAIARAQASFEIVKGEDFQINWTVQASETSTTPVDITGWTFELKVKRTDADADPSVIVPVHTITNASTGQVKSVFAAAGTALLLGDYRFSFWRTNAGSLACLSRGFIGVIDTTQN
jgi:hypothetical protein